MAEETAQFIATKNRGTGWVGRKMKEREEGEEEEEEGKGIEFQ